MYMIYMIYIYIYFKGLAVLFILSGLTHLTQKKHLQIYLRSCYLALPGASSLASGKRGQVTGCSFGPASTEHPR